MASRKEALSTGDRFLSSFGISISQRRCDKIYMSLTLLFHTRWRTELRRLKTARQEASSRHMLEFALAITACSVELKRDVLKVQNIISEREVPSCFIGFGLS